MLRAAVDSETTGLAKGRDEIIEIAVIPFDEQYNPIGRFCTLIKPLRGVNPAALAVNKITESMLAGAPTPLQVRSAFMDWKYNILGDEKIELLGHNVTGFDRPFLDYFFTPDVTQELFSHRADDTMVLSRALKQAGLLPGLKSCGLIELVKYFNIVVVNEHRAYDDALASLMIWKHLLSILSNIHPMM
jgi:DNA polymerase III alpha subunit (gram-positive type)